MKDKIKKIIVKHAMFLDYDMNSDGEVMDYEHYRLDIDDLEALASDLELFFKNQ